MPHFSVLADDDVTTYLGVSQTPFAANPLVRLVTYLMLKALFASPDF